jgi:hypothetical protein
VPGRLLFYKGHPIVRMSSCASPARLCVALFY